MSAEDGRRWTNLSPGEYRDWHAKYERERRAKNPTSARRARRGSLLRKYGVTAEQYDEMLAAQAGRCAICGTSDPTKGYGKPRAFCVDHDHSTGAVRGLLCTACNVGIGKLEGSAALLSRAAQYVRGVAA